MNILRNHGDGTFAESVEFFPGSYPQSLAITDFNQDGRNDIVTANQFDSPPSIGLLINQTPLPILGDITGDGAVDVLDLLAVIGAWGLCLPPYASCPADLDGNGVVNVLDLLIVIGNWG